jgi:PAS domain S-box-containing protein
MLIVPHHFSAQTYDALRPNLGLLGTVTLLVGLAMLLVSALRPTGWLAIAAHASAGLTLLLLAAGLALTGGWFGATIYAVLAVGTLIAAAIIRVPEGATPVDGSNHAHQPAQPRADLFAILIGAAFALNGLASLVFPAQVRAPAFDSLRPFLPWYGLLLVLFGALVVVTQLSARASVKVRWLGCLALVATAVGPLLGQAIVNRIWTGIALYGETAVVLLLLPWLGPLLERIDPGSMRTRLAVTFALTGALALVLIVVVDANREETSIRQQMLAAQQSLAVSVSRDVVDYVQLHQAAVRALAASPGLLEASPEQQHAWLQAYKAAYPDAAVLTLFSADGRQIARGDDLPLGPPITPEIVAQLRETRNLRLAVILARSIERPVFAVLAPILGPDGTMRGVVGAAVESARLAEQLVRSAPTPDERAYLVDSQGRAIAHPDTSLVASFADLKSQPPVAELLADTDDADSMVYVEGREEWLAGMARAPGLGWGVVVERPASLALASVRIGRERAFLALLAIVVGAMVIGAIVAGWLTAPLAALATVVRRLADDPGPMRLETGGVTEAAGLASAFSEMQARLSARTHERERSEAALRESEQRFRTMANSAPVLIWTSGTDGGCDFFNDGWLTFTGRPTAEQVGDGWAEGVHPDDLARCVETYRTAFDARRPFEMEYRLRRADGEYRWIVDQAAPRVAPDGSFAGYIGSCIDITERRQTVEIQRLLADAGSQLVSSLDIETILRGIAELVISTIADYCIIELRDEREQRSLEIAHADLTRAAWMRALLERSDDADAVAEPRPIVWTEQSVLVPRVTSRPAAEQAADEPVAGASTPLTRALGAQLGAYALICVPLLARGRTIGTLALIAAESGRQYAPDDLGLAEALAARAALAVDNARLYGEAQAAVQARDEFLSIASHELRTPVTSIKGYAQLLRRAQDRDRLDPERLARSLGSIDEAAGRLVTLTQDLLDVSRIRLGQLPLRAQEIDLAALVERAVHRLREQLADGYELILEIEAAPCIVQADPDRLEQVMTNLLENAVKYSPDGGRIWVALRHDADHVQLTVRDEGIGLPEEATETIFRPFGRAANASEHNLPGMGLGLYICRSIIERHGGQITASSEGERRGTTLSVELPVRIPDAPTPAHLPA